MSKKQNTLFNYFAKSPASVKKLKCENSSLEDSISKDKDTPSKSSKRELDSSQDEDIKLSQKKRRRIVSESESESENHDNSSEGHDEKENKSNGNKDQQDDFKNLPFKEKLNTLKYESKEISETDVIKTEKSQDDDESMVFLHNKLDFIKPENIKDKKGRRPDHPDYNPRTLYVPERFLSTLSPVERQWWEMKSENFDCVLFFKLGKFYELYHMDADIGVTELGCIYMKGELAHSGFPEVSYNKMATKLIDQGYKIARVEQVETPEMMSQRCKKSKMTTKYDRVVKREICQISNRGTRIYGTQLEVSCDYKPNYMLMIVEKDQGLFSTFGVCFVDTSIGDFYIGEFDDDKNNSRLLTLLSHYPPALVLLEKRGISIRTENELKPVFSEVLRENLHLESQFQSPEKILKYLIENYFTEGEEKKWPDALKSLQNEDDPLGLTANENSKLALKALGGCIWYLKKCLIDQQVLSVARFNIYYPPDFQNKMNINEEKDEKSVFKKLHHNRHMVLDYTALNNLNVIGEGRSLLNTLDHCVTKFGKRLLYNWICAPSCDIYIIKERQDAISELLNNLDILKDLRSLLIDLPDFDRHLAQIHGFGNVNKLKDHPDGRAILFEEKTYNKRKIQDFISILKGFKSLINIPDMFSTFESPLIVRLTQLEPEGIYPDMNEILNFFETAFNHDEALKEGIIVPKKGIDSEVDAIENEIEQINNELQDYLKEQEKYFGCRLEYFGNDKKRFQLEVPESHSKKADSNYFLESQKKGSAPARRFHTNETREFLRRMMQAEEQRNSALKDVSRRIFEKFSNHYSVWKRCVDSIAILDVLGSLAEYANNQNQICIPEVYEGSNEPFIYLEEGYYPCLSSFDNFIPNGICLGGPKNPPLFILTGPNMGGKSTLMRQVGLLMIMTQMGSHIPAKSCKISIIDRIFTRIGAQDDLLAGHSTFLVELNETSTILKHSTKSSLILLDELGRGTSTYDGVSVAASVVHFLMNLKCRTIFSTHYHYLTNYFRIDNRIALGHMACVVENEDTDNPTEENVTFLYKCIEGACPASFGFTAAKLAGIPLNVIKRSHELMKSIGSINLQKEIISQVMNNNVESIKELANKLKTNSCK